MNPWLERVVLSLVGLTFMAMMAYANRELTFTGKNDFAPLYNGTQLLGTPYLYSFDHNMDLLEKHIDGVNPSLRYTRPPYYATLLWPLGRLPYLHAYWLWSFISLSAIAAFAFLWRIPSPGQAFVLTAFSLPAFQAVMNGQDTPLLLLWVALAVHFERKGKSLAAGWILALCAAKFHLFLLLPLLFVGQKRWRMATGFASGTACLVVISFAVAGRNWPLEYYATLIDPRVNPDVFEMPNLHGLFLGVPFAGLLEVAGSLAVILAAWKVVRQSSFEYGLAASLVGSLLISYHAYLSDCAILLPAGTVIYSQATSRLTRLLGALLLTPFLYFLLIAPRPASYAVPVVIAGFFAGAVWHALRQASPGQTFVTSPVNSPSA